MGRVKKVIALNLLGSPSTHWRETPMEVVRHYKFVSAVEGQDFHEIDALQLIQYNLLSPQIDGLAEIELKEWLQFWKAAHQRKADEVANVKTPAVRSAYDRVRVANLPVDVKVGYDANIDGYLDFS